MFRSEYLLSAFKRTKRLRQQAPRWFSRMWVKSQFLQARTFWSKQICGLNFVLPFTTVSLFLTYQKWSLDCNKSVLCVYSEQTTEFYCLDKTIISVINSFVHIQLEWLDSLFSEMTTLHGGIITHVKGWISTCFQAWLTLQCVFCW